MLDMDIKLFKDIQNESLRLIEGKRTFILKWAPTEEEMIKNSFSNLLNNIKDEDEYKKIIIDTHNALLYLFDISYKIWSGFPSQHIYIDVIIKNINDKYPNIDIVTKNFVTIVNLTNLYNRFFENNNKVLKNFII